MGFFFADIFDVANETFEIADRLIRDFNKNPLTCRRNYRWSLSSVSIRLKFLEDGYIEMQHYGYCNQALDPRDLVNLKREIVGYCDVMNYKLIGCEVTRPGPYNEVYLTSKIKFR